MDFHNTRGDPRNVCQEDVQDGCSHPTMDGRPLEYLRFSWTVRMDLITQLGVSEACPKLMSGVSQVDIPDRYSIADGSDIPDGSTRLKSQIEIDTPDGCRYPSRIGQMVIDISRPKEM